MISLNWHICFLHFFSSTLHNMLCLIDQEQSKAPPSKSTDIWLAWKSCGAFKIVFSEIFTTEEGSNLDAPLISTKDVIFDATHNVSYRFTFVFFPVFPYTRRFDYLFWRTRRHIWWTSLLRVFCPGNNRGYRNLHLWNVLTP